MQLPRQSELEEKSILEDEPHIKCPCVWLGERDTPERCGLGAKMMAALGTTALDK